MTAFVAVSAVRDYLEVNAGSTSKYSDALIGSNIRAASAFIERRTGRQFERVTATKVFTTHGRAAVTIPGLASASAVTLQGSTLTADSTYWLLPDAQQTGLYTAIQVRNFGTYDYRSNPEWFDRNLDSPYWNRYGMASSLPNDLSITGTWGLLPADYPEPLLHATKVLAAWYTKRPDSILANVAITAEGTALDYSNIPPEVGDFIAAYKLDSDQVVSVG